MYRKTEDFIKDWKYETESTIKVFSNIPDSALDRKFGEGVRSIGTLVWHITGSGVEMLNRAGLEVQGPDEAAPRLATMKELIGAYAGMAESILNEVKNKWPDSTLTDSIEMYGETWTKGQTLAVLVMHQAHHRGQLSVLMRLAGAKVPGVYGPAYEEWAAMGLPPMV